MTDLLVVDVGLGVVVRIDDDDAACPCLPRTVADVDRPDN